MAANILKPALIGLALSFAAPAMAGGTVQVTVTASGPEARALLGGLLVLKAAGKSARVVQTGKANAAAVAQSGKGNRALVRQSGSGHSVTVAQSGRGNRLGVFQFGKGTSADIDQSGRGKTGLVVIGGW